MESLSTILARLPAPPPVAPVDYPVSTTALAKWSKERLAVELDDDVLRFRYQIDGSLCRQGGVAFTGEVQLELEPRADGWFVSDGRILIPPEHLLAATRQCAALGKTDRFLDQLDQSPPFCGRGLEDILEKPDPAMPSGCLCTDSMLMHKWLLALSTIHYALA